MAFPLSSTRLGAMALTATERQAVVDAHNNYRQLVASGSETNKNGAKLQPAADMSKIVRALRLEPPSIENSCRFTTAESRRSRRSGPPDANSSIRPPATGPARTFT